MYGKLGVYFVLQAWTTSLYIYTLESEVGSSSVRPRTAPSRGVVARRRRAAPGGETFGTPLFVDRLVIYVADVASRDDAELYDAFQVNDDDGVSSSRTVGNTLSSRAF